jgi:hypothetical protein
MKQKKQDNYGGIEEDTSLLSLGVFFLVGMLFIVGMIFILSSP